MDEVSLRTFAKQLNPSEDKENRALDTISTLLKGKSGFAIDRIIICGSFGKSIALEGFDIDLVAFVNHENPPFKAVIENWAEIVEKEYATIQVRTTAHSVQFCLNGIEFDVLPAPNHVLGFIPKSKSVQGSKNERIGYQRSSVHRKIKEHLKATGKYSSKFSSGLAESQVQFMKKQAAHAHELVRLAKFWFKSTPMEKFPGCSMILELIATHCAEKNSRIVEAFRLFLTLMTILQSANFTFNSCVSNSIKGQIPMILDPSNPYNNLGNKLKNPKYKRIQLFKKYAEETLNRLNSASMSVEKLFKPQQV